ncbi:MAG: hypothetical protein HYY40_11865 [Bacteroidetes bacterium]|nr:hypothetical protein [Bacteroidota bacterium]
MSANRRIPERIIFLLSGMLLLWFSCTRDFVVPDLENKTVTVIAPPDSFITTTVTLTFWWDEIRDAEKYNIQIVSPSFSSVQYLLVDSNLATNKFTYTLNPGTYGWRIKGFNSASSTAYTTYFLTIDSTSDLSSQVIVLASPANNYTTKNMNITFRWNTLYNASDYRFEIATPDFNGTQVISPVITTADSAQHTFTSEGNYEWRVRGENTSSVTPYTVYSLDIDTARPNAPVLVSPANNTILTDSVVTFYWDRGTVSGSAIQDTLFVYSDSLMATVAIEAYTSNTSFSDTLSAGKYFWRVRSVDAAGNISPYSNLNKVTIQ